MEILKKEPYRTIFPLLSGGKQNAVPVAEIIKATGLEDRAVRKAVERMTVDGGLPICSCAKGYYFAADLQELEGYIRTCEKVIRIASVRLATAKRARTNMMNADQMDLGV